MYSNIEMQTDTVLTKVLRLHNKCWPAALQETGCSGTRRESNGNYCPSGQNSVVSSWAVPSSVEEPTDSQEGTGYLA